MDDQKTRELDILIAQSDDVDFAPKKDWGRQEFIKQAEQELGFKLPNSYKWWVNNYKGGSIGFDQELYTIEEKVPGVVSATNIVVEHLRANNNPGLPENALVFFAPFEGDEIYFFEVSEGPDEYLVFVYRRFDRFIEPYANDFIDFMIHFIKLNYPITPSLA